MGKIKNFLVGSKKRIIISSLVVIALLLLILSSFAKDESVEYVTAFVKKGNLVQTVSETGMVKSAQAVDLSFSGSGRLAENFFSIGDEVKSGQELAALDYSLLLIKQKEAFAALAAARSNFEKVLAGATATQVGVGRAGAQQAQVAYEAALTDLENTKNVVEENIDQAEQNLKDIESNSPADVTPYEYAVFAAEDNLVKTQNTYLQNIYNLEDSALSLVENKSAVANTALDQLDQIINNIDKEKVLSTQKPIYLTNAQSSYSESLIFSSVVAASLSLAKNTFADNDIAAALSDCLNFLNEVFASLNYTYKALENTPSSNYFTQTEIETDKATVSSQLSAISAAISAVQAAQQNLVDAILSYDSQITAAQNNLTTAQTNLEDAIKKARNTLTTVKLSGAQQIAIAEARVANALESWNYAQAQFTEVVSPARSEEISFYESQTLQAEANYDLISKQIEESIIKSPVDGMVVKTNYEVGEQVVAGSPVVSVLKSSKFEIDVDISEADIFKVSVGNGAEITLDAFGDDIIFPGVVSFVEPAETIIQGVVYYKTTIQFSDNNSLDKVYYNSIKPGMTANIIITTVERDGALFVPTRAILEKNGSEKYVRVLDKKGFVEVPVEVGLKGDGGLTEILEGLKEEDEVITFIKEQK